MRGATSKPFPFVADPALLVESEDELRVHALVSCMGLNPSEERLTIRHVTIIGARAVDFNRVREDRDSARLCLLLRYLMDSDIPVHPHFRVDCVDFRDGRDFLAETTPTDLVFASYIRGEPSSMSRYYGPDFESDVRKAFDNTTSPLASPEYQYYHAQSPLTEDDGWRRRVRASGARIFAAFGGAIEVGTAHVSVAGDIHDPYETLLPNPNLIDALPRDHQQTLEYIYPMQQGLDVPMTWLGITMLKSYGRDLARFTRDPETWLARRLHAKFGDAVAPRQARRQGLFGSLFPGLRSVFELQGNHVGLGWPHREGAYAKRHHRPQNRMNP